MALLSELNDFRISVGFVEISNVKLQLVKYECWKCSLRFSNLISTISL